MAGDGVEVEVANVIAVASCSLSPVLALLLFGLFGRGQAIWLGTVQTRAKRAFEKCVRISAGSSPSVESSICGFFSAPAPALKDANTPRQRCTASAL